MQTRLAFLGIEPFSQSSLVEMEMCAWSVSSLDSRGEGLMLRLELTAGHETSGGGTASEYACLEDLMEVPCGAEPSWNS